ncbi:MAG: Sua5/YciO/YrdC/YwlC family protein [Dokdonella sp.]
MSEQIALAVAALRDGWIIAYPTESVFGLGCDPHSRAACERLFALKLRPAGQGVLLIASEFEQVEPYIGSASDAALARAHATWPGPQTWVFPRSDRVPAWIAGAHTGIALRVTAHPVAAELCHAFGGALVSTSANRHGQAPLRDAVAVRATFGDDVAVVVDGSLGGLERPTPIGDAMTGELLRR